MAYTIQPSLDQVKSLLITEKRGNIVPLYTTLPGDLLTAVGAYLKISENSKYSFLFESVVGGERIGRHDFVGADPFRVLVSGTTPENTGDPLIELEKALDEYKYVEIPGIPSFTGGAVGFVGYDNVHFFEPKTARPLHDPLGIPDALFMFYDTLICFDHLYQLVKIMSHVHVPDPVANPGQVESAYEEASARLDKLYNLLLSPRTPLPPQPPIREISASEIRSNVGKDGYEGFVSTLKKHIKKGDIIQAVPSQRIERPTSVHPFNVYRHLRTLNPSSYMFYVDCGDYQFVGASPEMLVKVDKNLVYAHPIAGTVRRGKTEEEDDRLAQELLASPKDRAEHIMLVDLARNDVNRVCDPRTTKVDSLMHIEKFSHVMHIVSQVSGTLRAGQTRFDAFRSIFPAGTVSGAPKVRAMELIGELEGEKRGVYGGAVGRFNFASHSLDTCIAIRTMTFKNGVAYLQAGGGIVFDSNEEDEYIESLNKLKANVQCLAGAEAFYRRQQAATNVSPAAPATNGTKVVL